MKRQHTSCEASWTSKAACSSQTELEIPFTLHVDIHSLRILALPVRQFDLIVASLVSGGFLELELHHLFLDVDFHVFGGERLSVVEQLGHKLRLLLAMDCKRIESMSALHGGAGFQG